MGVLLPTDAISQELGVQDKDFRTFTTTTKATRPQNGCPDLAKPGVRNLSAITTLVNMYLSPLLLPLGCPQLQPFDQELFNKFPGMTYNPTRNDTIY